MTGINKVINFERVVSVSLLRKSDSMTGFCRFWKIPNDFQLPKIAFPRNIC